MNLLDIVARFIGDTKGIDKAIADTETKAGGMGDRIAGNLSTGLKRGAGALAAGGSVLLGVATKGAVELQNATLDYQAATGATAEEAKVAAKSIADLNKVNLQGMGEITDTLIAVKTNLGLTGAEAETTADKILKFAKVTGQSGVAATTALDDIIDSFNLTGAQGAAVLDQLVASQQKYGGSVTESQAALSKLAPALTAANLKADDGIAIMNLFAAKGLSASDATAALTKALTKVKSPEELQQLIADISATEDPLLRAQKASDLFGAKAGPRLANALAGANLADYQVSVEDATGAIDKASDTIDSKFGNQITLAVKKAGTALAEFGQGLGPAITGLGSLAAAGAPIAAKLIPGIGTALSGGVAKLLPMLTTSLLPLIAGIVPAAGTALAAAGSAMGGLIAAAIPIGMALLPVLLVAAIVAAIVFLVNNPEIVSQILDFLKGILDLIVQGLAALPAIFGQAAGAAIGALGKLVGGVAGLIGQVVGIILSIPGKVAGWVPQLLLQAARIYVGIWQKIFGLVGDIVRVVLSIPGKVASWAVSLVAQAAVMASSLGNKIISLVGNIVGWFLSIPGRLVSLGGQIVSSIIRGLASLPGRLFNAVANAFRGLHIDIGPFHISASGVTIDLPHFAEGTDFVPRTMLAVVHKGERILTAAENEAVNAGRAIVGRVAGATGGGGLTVGEVNLYGIGNDVSPLAARRFGQEILDVVAGGLREQTARTTGA